MLCPNICIDSSSIEICYGQKLQVLHVQTMKAYTELNTAYSTNHGSTNG